MYKQTPGSKTHKKYLVRNMDVPNSVILSLKTFKKKRKNGYVFNVGKK